MSKFHLKPSEAAKLASDVYTVNENNKTKLKIFINQPLFRKNSSRQQTKMLKAKVGGHLLRATEDAFGIAAYGAEGTRFANDLFLIFRGTTTANNKADFITDVRAGITISAKGKPVHSGFNSCFNSMRKQITDFTAGQTFSGRVHCIDHSLGGAVASLAADWCYPHISKEVILYSFDSPRVGLSTFSSITTLKLKKTNIHRTFADTDPVPMVPIFPYTHLPFASYGHRLESKDLIRSGEAHKMQHYVRKLKPFAQWNDVPRARAPFNHESLIEEWLDSYRMEDISDSMTLQAVEMGVHWLLKKIGGVIFEGVHTLAVGVHTFIDLLAKEFERAVRVGSEAGRLVTKFMRKLVRILGIPEKLLEQNTTRQYFTYLLRTLVTRAHELAQKAIRNLSK